MTNAELKGSEIRKAYEKLYREGKKRGTIVTTLAKQYFLTERQIYNHIKVKSLRKDRKLTRQIS